MLSSPSRPRWTSHPCSSTTLPLRWEQTRPIGNGTVRLSGIGRGTSKKVHTFVSVGPYRLKYLGTGNNAVRVRKCRTGKTSPANNIRRSAEWSWFCRFPYWASKLRMEGAEYQHVICCSAISAARRRGSLPTSSAMSTSVAPCLRGTWISRMERSKWNGACEEKRSLVIGSNTSEHQSTKLTAFSWESITPLGLPVEPDVYRI